MVRRARVSTQTLQWKTGGEVERGAATAGDPAPKAVFSPPLAGAVSLSHTGSHDQCMGHVTGVSGADCVCTTSALAGTERGAHHVDLPPGHPVFSASLRS